MKTIVLQQKVKGKKKKARKIPEAEEAYGAKNSAKRLARLYEFIR